MKPNIKLSPEEIAAIIADKNVRVALAKQSSLWFASIYFPHYFTYDFAKFHYDLFNNIDQADWQLFIAIMFRGSGKSTIMTTIYPLYALFGKPSKKLIVIVCQTAELARIHLRNIKTELETNQLLKEDLGPFKEVDNIWNAQAIELPQQNAMIIAISIDQGIRGLRYKQHRPDLIIVDDIEDSQSVRTEESRRHTQELYSSEIAPLGDLDTQTVMIGNYLSPNGLLSKLRNDIEQGEIKGKSLFVPLVTTTGQITWPEKFPTLADVYQLKAMVADETIWLREYELRIVANSDLYYTFENIEFYDQISTAWKPYFLYRITAADLAISQEKTADYTAIISADVYRVNGVIHIFILPSIINRRMKYHEICNTLEFIGMQTPKPFIYVEDTGFQRIFAQELQSHNTIAIFPFSVKGMSKQERLSLTALWHQHGQIHFPRVGAELVINQLIGFGKENHDDLVDAYSMLVMQVQELTRQGASPTDPSQPAIMVVRDNSLWQVKNPNGRGLRLLQNDRLGWDR